jgi:hypothetical protein
MGGVHSAASSGGRPRSGSSTSSSPSTALCGISDSTSGIIDSDPNHRRSARYGSLCMKTCADQRESKWLRLQSWMRSAAIAEFSNTAAVASSLTRG